MKRNIMALTVMAALSSTAMANENTWQGETKDAWIDGKAEASLLFNTELNSFKIETDVDNGNVTLRGNVESEMDKQLAEEVVSDIDGVMSVNNMLVVQRDGMDDTDDMNRQTGSAMTSTAMNTERDTEMTRMDDADMGMATADTRISESIKTRLMRESDFTAKTIDIDVDNRVVTLKGKVKSESEREIALAIAEDTDNVDSVKDELTVVNKY
ncbi:BON domain-containing protein [Alteromonas oceanisediminis]|uniref:BON domain-containing protein n=1 Tax=Alteromonas oceanisediminis TaxID=2836180 RepID=UPI001BD9AC7F|nr:BON domain-containing protein [Alteromonas oceanisediminis]MBT0585289.1 BON domain-containing protein [Alteromonas oceanisediminis]